MALTTTWPVALMPEYEAVTGKDPADMPRNDDGSYCVADCVEWAMERLENTEPGADDVDEALQWLTAFRKERALKAKMEREELEGKRFPRGEVTAAWCNR